MNYVYNCKICGAPLEVDSTSTVVTCRYCKRANTISLSGEKSARLLNDANKSRLCGDFEQAKSKYFAIINEYVEEPEAYWGLLLCEYGVSYVDDPINGEKVPTCYKHVLNSVYNNTYYTNAVEFARDLSMKALYEKQAREIDEIQYEIAHSSQNKYDVFISYKETDDTSKSRTEDSNLAYELYFELERKGYNVFFARKTLPKGIPYEPVIFSALKSSKAMIVLGTKPQYINAPWVRNEWERFIHQINQGADKKIVVAYKNLEPYLLPEKLQHLQGINLGEMTALSEIIDFVDKNINKTSFQEQNSTNSQSSVQSLLTRAMLFMEDGNWKDADSYCEKVLDIEPTNSTAYLYKLLTEHKVLSIETLSKKAAEIDNSLNYKKAVKFSDEKTKVNLELCRKQCIYNLAYSIMSVSQSEQKFKEASNKFYSIRGFKDSDNLVLLCNDKAEIARKEKVYSDAIKSLNDFEFKKTISRLEIIKDYSNVKTTILFINKVIDFIQRVDYLIAFKEKTIEKMKNKQTIWNGKKSIANIIFPIILTILMYIFTIGFVGPSEILPDVLGSGFFSSLFSLLIIFIGPIIVGFISFHIINTVGVPSKYTDENDKNDVAKLTQFSIDIKEMISKIKEKNDIEKAIDKLNELEVSLELLQKEIYHKANNQKNTEKKEATRKRKVVIISIFLVILLTGSFFVARKLVLTDKYENIIVKIDANELSSYSEYLEAYNDLKDNPYADLAEEYIKKIEIRYPYISFNSIEAGDIISFGQYEQNGDESRIEPIEWIVVYNSDGKITAVSRYVLASMSYEGKDYTWENSDIRKWLNGDFLNESFSKIEEKHLFPQRGNDLVQLITRGAYNRMDGKLKKYREAISISSLAVECAEYWIGVPEPVFSWWMVDYVKTTNGNTSIGDKKPDEHSGVRPMITIDYLV